MPYDFYNIGAARGRVVGQGLMGMGQVVSGTIERQRKAKIEEDERKERKKARQFTKTLSLVNLYTKMGDDLTPENRMKLYTGALIPMLAKAGGLPEGTKQEDVSKFIGSLAAHSKEKMQGFREDNNKLLDLVNDRKWKEADKFLSGMMIEYGKLPGAKTFLERAKTLLKEEKAYSRGKEDIKETRKYEATKEIHAGVLAGELEVIPEGQEGAFVNRPRVMDYGVTGLTVAGLSQKEKIKRAADKAGAIAGAKEKPEKITEKDKDTARKRISQIEKDYANLKTKGVTESELSLLSSDAQALIGHLKGQKLSSDDLDYVRKVYDNEIKALISTYGLKGYEKIRKPTKSNITHRFVPGKGLMPVE